MMADFGRDGAAWFGSAPAFACKRSISARVKPAPKAPILRKVRRLTPSQNPCLDPRNVNIQITPLKNVKCAAGLTDYVRTILCILPLHSAFGNRQIHIYFIFGQLSFAFGPIRKIATLEKVCLPH